MNISGQQIKLGDVRSVFVGRSAEDDGLTYIKFVNEEGEETRISITDEARSALVALLSNEAHFARDNAGQWRPA